MKKFLKYLSAVVCVVLGAANCVAGDEGDFNTISNSFMLGVGTAHRADTYLTPLHYTGTVTGVDYEHFRIARRIPLAWSLTAGLDIDRTENPVRNSVMLGAQFEVEAAVYRRFSAGRRVRFGIGGCTVLDAGALYLSRNGNNPVAANASWTVGVAGYATASFRIGRMPVVATYKAELPVVGAMFAPDYGQLYYEIYLGDTAGIFSGAWWGRYFRINQRLSLDLKIRHKYLRIGYAPEIQSTKVNGVVSRRINHTFVLGLTIM